MRYNADISKKFAYLIPISRSFGKLKLWNCLQSFNQTLRYSKLWLPKKLKSRINNNSDYLFILNPIKVLASRLKIQLELNERSKKH